MSSHTLYQAREQLKCGNKHALIIGKTSFISLLERCKNMRVDLYLLHRLSSKNQCQYRKQKPIRDKIILGNSLKHNIIQY